MMMLCIGAPLQATASRNCGLALMQLMDDDDEAEDARETLKLAIKAAHVAGDSGVSSQGVESWSAANSPL